MTEFKKQSEFPLIESYRKVFDTTPKTIFAYENTIYCDYELSPDLLIHEQVHLDRQNEQGLDEWIKNYLNDPVFRLNEEWLAYKAQLNSIKDKNERTRVRIKSALILSSSLYGDIITYKDALKMLK